MSTKMSAQTLATTIRQSSDYPELRQRLLEQFEAADNTPRWSEPQTVGDAEVTELTTTFLNGRISVFSKEELDYVVGNVWFGTASARTAGAFVTGDSIAAVKRKVLRAYWVELEKELDEVWELWQRANAEEHPVEDHG
jgi:hypothetical protein